MQIGLNDLSYAPTIHLKPAELTAVEHLSALDKDAIVPIVLLKPWATSKSISRAMERFEQAYSERKYYVQCDPGYNKPAGHSEAADEFRVLCDADTEFVAWWQFLENWPNAMPAIPLSNDIAAFAGQVKRAEDLGRGFLICVPRLSGQDKGPIVSALADVEHNNYMVCLDVGWGRDILSSEMWADGWIKAITGVNDDVRIIVAGSSFPRDFSRYGTFGEEVSLERVLFANLRKRNNQAHLIYGDWGSSRSSVEQGGGIVVPRIDIPRQRGWYFFRAKDSSGSYHETAKTAVGSDKWTYEPDVWGKYVVLSTSIGQGYVIDSARKSTEARINMHLHQQIAFDDGPNGQAVEEDYVD